MKQAKEETRETNPMDSKSGTICRDFHIQVDRDIIRGNELESAETSLWFHPKEPVDCKASAPNHIYE